MPYKFEPIFDVPENIGIGIGDKKISEKVKAIVNYKVVEKTKNYVILRIGSLYLTPSRRTF